MADEQKVAKSLLETMGTATKALAGIIGVLVLAAVIIYVAVEACRDYVYVEPFAVSQAFLAVGIDGTQAANGYLEAIDRLREDTLTRIPERHRLRLAGTQFSAKIPHADIDTQNLRRIVRGILRKDDILITGEVGQRDNVVTLVLREGSRTQRFEAPGEADRSTLDRLLYSGAEFYFERTRPYILALIKADRRDPQRFKYCDDALAKGPKEDAVWVHNLLGLLHDDAGNEAAAVKSYNDALRIDPCFAPALSNLGCLYLYTKKDPQQAIGYLRRSVGCDGGIPNVRVHLANAYSGLREFTQADGQYQKAIELEHTNDFARLSWIDSLASRGDHRTAAEKAREAVSVLPLDTSMLFRRVETELELGEFAIAFRDLALAVDLGVKIEEDRLSAVFAKMEAAPAGQLPNGALTELRSRRKGLVGDYAAAIGLLEYAINEGWRPAGQGTDACEDRWSCAFEDSPANAEACYRLMVSEAQRHHVEHALRTACRYRDDCNPSQLNEREDG